MILWEYSTIKLASNALKQWTLFFKEAGLVLFKKQFK
jgi:hypothetical protein